jgi:hypothetical protein
MKYQFQTIFTFSHLSVSVFATILRHYPIQESQLPLGTESRLTRIKWRCFFGCSLKSISILRFVQVLNLESFSRSQLEHVTFDSESRVTELETNCSACNHFMSIHIPKSVRIVGDHVLPRHGVTFIRPDSQLKKHGYRRKSHESIRFAMRVPDQQVRWKNSKMQFPKQICICNKSSEQAEQSGSITCCGSRRSYS